jgi:hypothetical protein
MPYMTAKTVGYNYTPTTKILSLWLRYAMDKTFEGRHGKISTVLKNTMPTLIESLTAIVSSPDSKVSEKLEAAAILRSIQNRDALAKMSAAKTAMREAHTKVKEKSTTLRKQIREDVANRKIEKVLKAAEQGGVTNGATNAQ